MAITACTVVQAVVKANTQSNGNGQTSILRCSEIPERLLIIPGIDGLTENVENAGEKCGGVRHVMESQMMESQMWCFFVVSNQTLTMSEE